MAEFDLRDLYTKYEGFVEPVCKVYLGGTDPADVKKNRLTYSHINVELSSDFKASLATFILIGGFDETNGIYDMKLLKKYIGLGTDVKIALGHGPGMREVFKGYIARVEFVYHPYEELLGVVRITAMDIKGIMMANNSSKRLNANYYSDAVDEIFKGMTYQNLVQRDIITDLDVRPTPDKPASPPGGAPAPAGPPGETPDNRIEMVAESDYDFVVRAAKKFNFEFFSIGGNVTFRPAKSNTQDLIDIIPSSIIQDFDIGYDLTGLVGEVKVRTLDIAKAQKIEVKKKNTGKFSLSGKAKSLVSNQVYVYTDSSIETQTDADLRATYIMEDMSYRFGSISMTLAGIPELVPGRFINLKGFGDGVSNKYYLTDVIHTYGDDGYLTTIIGKASTL